MGLVTNFKDEQALEQAYTVDILSTALVSVIEAIGNDEEIFELLYYTNNDSLNSLEDDEVGKKVFKNKGIYKHGSKEQRIEPYPFSYDLQTQHECFIRCYFNQGNNMRGNGYWDNNQMNIDILCSRGLWLTADKSKKIKIIRPYAIMSRIQKILQSDNKSKNKLPQPSGYQHFTVNESFECIRLYVNLEIIGNEVVSR